MSSDFCPQCYGPTPDELDQARQQGRSEALAQVRKAIRDRYSQLAGDPDATGKREGLSEAEWLVIAAMKS